MTQPKTTPKAGPAAAPKGGTEAVRPAPAGDRLHRGAGQLSVPEPLADAESMLLKIGMLLPIVGLGLIGFAWYAASGTALVNEQVPYLISGGLIGLALVLVGTGLFLRYSLTRLFRFWLARMLVEHQTQTDRLIDALDRVENTIRKTQVGK